MTFPTTPTIVRQPRNIGSALAQRVFARVVTVRQRLVDDRYRQGSLPILRAEITSLPRPADSDDRER
jgi:hypothetical protein